MATEMRNKESMGNTAQLEREKTGPVTWEEMKTLLGREPGLSQKTWKPTTGGLLAIVSGYLNILSGILLIAGVSFFTFAAFPTGLVLGLVVIALGVLSVIGGIFALRRRAWGMALIGSIASLVPSLGLIPGTLSLILVTLGRKEFGR